jgi:DNA polymerase-3 subunit delta'
VVGHEWAVEYLKNSMRRGRIGHAYLFVGPAQIGKTTLARAFAQAVNCDADDAPCGHCRLCRLVQNDRHPDVCIVTPEKDRIKIDAIRDMQRTLALAPVEGRYRVCIIRRIDVATLQAQNCLLKTLEEPSARVILVLTADQSASLLPTVTSRCQNLALRRTPTGQIASALQEKGVAPEEANLLAHLAHGRIGWALQASEDRERLEDRARVLEQVAVLDGATCTARFAWAQRLSRRPERVPATLATMTSWWRDVLLTAAGSSAALTHVDCREQLGEWAMRYGVRAAGQALSSLRDTTQSLQRNANLRLALEVLAMDLPWSP